jgi:hypothetical protein
MSTPRLSWCLMKAMTSFRIRVKDDASERSVETMDGLVDVTDGAVW